MFLENIMKRNLKKNRSTKKIKVLHLKASAHSINNKTLRALNYCLEEIILTNRCLILIIFLRIYMTKMKKKNKMNLRDSIATKSQ
jgi:hypothetical protein